MEVPYLITEPDYELPSLPTSASPPMSGSEWVGRSVLLLC